MVKRQLFLCFRALWPISTSIRENWTGVFVFLVAWVLDHPHSLSPLLLPNWFLILSTPDSDSQFRCDSFSSGTDLRLPMHLYPISYLPSASMQNPLFQRNLVQHRPCGWSSQSWGQPQYHMTSDVKVTSHSMSWGGTTQLPRTEWKEVWQS